MATNGMDRIAEQWLKEEAGQELALAPLVNKIAFGLAKGLVVAMKELENHIASETRSVGETVGRRLDTLQASFQDLSERVSEQRSISVATQERCQKLEAATGSLQESHARHTAELAAARGETRELAASAAERIDGLRKDVGSHHQELAALRSETREFSTAVSGRVDGLSKDLGVQQEDIAAIKSALTGFSARIDAVVERLDRQAEALRSMYATYAQRETELEQLVDGLARLRSYPAQAPASGL